MYRLIYIQYIYHRGKLEFSCLSSLANTEGGLEAPTPLPLLQGTKQPGLTDELCVLTGLTAKFPRSGLANKYQKGDRSSHNSVDVS